jgi:hypothetical protein
MIDLKDVASLIKLVGFEADDYQVKDLLTLLEEKDPYLELHEYCEEDIITPSQSFKTYIVPSFGIMIEILDNVLISISFRIAFGNKSYTENDKLYPGNFPNGLQDCFVSLRPTTSIISAVIAVDFAGASR